MDDSTKRILQRLMRRIPSQMLQTMLGKWAHLSREDLHSLDFTQPKWVLTEHLLALCEENGLRVKHITELEMIYIIENPNQGMWHGFQLLDAEEDAPSIELTQFKKQFKANLTELISNVSIKIKKHTDEAIWIRVAWGDNFTKPNHLKPTYVVHHLQTPYVFVTGLTSKYKPLLNQALVLATRYGSMKDAHLSGRNLTAIRDLLMRQYQQVFPTKNPKPLQEKNPVPRNPNIEKEHAENTENRLQIACEAFGDGTLPQLQKAVYKLETKFRDNSNKTLTGREEPFRGVVEFASTNLLESLRHCVSSGMASTPVTPLLSSITQKGRNYFVITDKGV
ncbi:centromere protein N isoform X1 [Oncorhynchus tshawytscha]|uniref:Centromere protein N n=2 Tax=Oncorhynchus tshawytscha TaxID=74940 RepID=A0A8C8C0C0_ONCTS|nr:centromere protein N isoform X1 [Oncorhynchus tshawytscha]XP_024274828.1 centromere protein N isoform X1 [Oncorhynchus tshawytscha]